MVKVMVGRRGCKALEDTVLAIKVLTAFMSCLCAYGIFQHMSCFSRNGACARYALSKTFDRENSRTWLHIYVHVTPLSRDTLYMNCNYSGRKPHIGKESMSERLSLLRHDSCRAAAEHLLRRRRVWGRQLQSSNVITVDTSLTHGSYPSGWATNFNGSQPEVSCSNQTTAICLNLTSWVRHTFFLSYCATRQNQQIIPMACCESHCAQQIDFTTARIVSNVCQGAPEAAT